MIKATVNDRRPNFRGSDGRLYLTRCYVGHGDGGRENWAPNVASGMCAWCGWHDPTTRDLMANEVVGDGGEE